MSCFPITKEAIDHLKSVDEKLGRAIDSIGTIHAEIVSDLFQSIVFSIVSQMISAKAASTISSRFVERFVPFTPETLALQSVESIQQCGISMRKAKNISEFSKKVVDGIFDLVQIRNMTDNEVIAQLSSLKGVGRWTAEMILIFTLERPDVVAWDDLALRRGMCQLYGLETISKEEFLGYAARYSPYGSTASLFLWEYSHIEK